ncbi:class I SAM-dependent methyltransferase [candidate division WOR-3 bacterium]|nr:class I SAM-dependent methyltransferase [candidate division WOR-3 bacterium]
MPQNHQDTKVHKKNYPPEADTTVGAYCNTPLQVFVAILKNCFLLDILELHHIMPIQMTTCNLCGSSENEYLYTKDGFDIVKCQRCGLVFVKNQPSSSALFYNIDYYKGAAYNDYVGERKQRIAWFKKRIKLINTLHLRKGKLLDIGCAVGFFVEVANDDGWDAQGVEISEYACNLAKEKGLKVFCDDFCYLDLGEKYKNYFDVITLYDTIEHVKDPKRVLLKANKYMKANGLLVVSTGDIESIGAKISRDRWYLLAPPYHLYFFSINTLRRLLERTGFSIIKIDKREGNVLPLFVFKKIIGNSCLNLLNQVSLKIIKRNMVAVLNYPLLRIIGGDIVTVYAIKK